MQSIVTVDNLIKRYRKAETNAVDGISFSVAAGEFFALLGPNGAGKTTTISILTTTLTKTHGAVTIAGHDLDRNATAVRRSIGVIFQTPSLDPNLTAEENVRFHCMLYGLYPFRPGYTLMPTAYQTRVKELAHLLEIEAVIFRPVKTFSSGMKRKLEIIRSLMHRPKLLFLDEPTTGLDPLSRKNLWQYLHRIRREQDATIFLTTHYLEEAEAADHIGIIHNGRIISFGTPQEIKRDLIEEYIEVDAENRRALTQELQRLALNFSHDPIRIRINGASPQRIIQSIATPLTLLKIHTPTLEEAYLEIIRRQEKT